VSRCDRDADDRPDDPEQRPEHAPPPPLRLPKKIVICVYQQVENYVLQPTIIGKATDISGFTVLVSV
jgi:hypothetical protein